MRGGLIYKAIIGKLAFNVCDFFFNLIQLLCQFFTFDGDVDLLFIDQPHVKTRGVADVRQLGERSLSKAQSLDTGLTSSKYQSQNSPQKKS